MDSDSDSNSDRGPGISHPPFPTLTKSRFESLPAELRLMIYSLLLAGKPGCYLLERDKLTQTLPKAGLHPAILAVNRSVSAEAYPILYGENKFLFLGTTTSTDNYHKLLAHLAEHLPKRPQPSLLPETSRPLIKHVVAEPLQMTKPDWASQLLRLAPATKTVEFRFSVRYFMSPTIFHASIPLIKSLINISTQTFRISIRDDHAQFRPSIMIAVLNLKGLDSLYEKRRKVYQVLKSLARVIYKLHTLVTPEKDLVWVDKRTLLHRDFAGFWSSDESKVKSEDQGWIPVDTNGQLVEIGSECKSITWRRSSTGYAKTKASFGYID